MELLEQRILRDGKVKPGGILKVDSFLNHQLDPMLMHKMAKELHRLFDGQGVEQDPDHRSLRHRARDHDRP